MNLYEYIIRGEKTLQTSFVNSLNHNTQRRYICTWYRKQHPENMVTSYETVKNVSELKGHMRRTDRILVDWKRDITYEYNVY